MNKLKLTPIMFGDCWKIENTLINKGYAELISGICMTDNGFIEYSYYEINGKVDLIFDAYSKYGTLWFFSN